MRISEYVENKKLCFSSEKIHFAPKYFPSSLMAIFGKLLMVKMEMEREFISNSPNQTTIITKHKLGSQLPIIGKLVDWGINKFLFAQQDHLDHLKEEEIYMKKNLEEN